MDQIMYLSQTVKCMVYFQGPCYFQEANAWICLRWPFYGFYHGKSPCFTTIWENMFYFKRLKYPDTELIVYLPTWMASFILCTQEVQKNKLCPLVGSGILYMDHPENHFLFGPRLRIGYIYCRWSYSRCFIMFSLPKANIPQLREN